jgi:hypothetical protein
MIIQINATVCAALDHGQGRQLKIAGRDLWRMLRGGQGRASTRRNEDSKSAAEMPGLAADAVWRSYEVITAAPVAKSLVTLAVSAGPLAISLHVGRLKCRPVGQSGG